MASQFRIERVAVHYVDRAMDSPRYGRGDIQLGPEHDDPEDEAIEAFLQEHLMHLWGHTKGTQSGRFDEASPVRATYERLSDDPSAFYVETCSLADRLHSVSQGVSASPGVLLCIWCLRTGSGVPYLGLLKLDPDEEHRITLGNRVGSESHVRLVVRHLQDALPGPQKMLKWAICPHPAYSYTASECPQCVTLTREALSSTTLI